MVRGAWVRHVGVSVTIWLLEIRDMQRAGVICIADRGTHCFLVRCGLSRKRLELRRVGLLPHTRLCGAHSRSKPQCTLLARLLVLRGTRRLPLASRSRKSRTVLGLHFLPGLMEGRVDLGHASPARHR